MCSHSRKPRGGDHGPRNPPSSHFASGGVKGTLRRPARSHQFKTWPQVPAHETPRAPGRRRLLYPPFTPPSGMEQGERRGRFWQQRVSSLSRQRLVLSRQKPRVCLSVSGSGGRRSCTLTEEPRNCSVRQVDGFFVPDVCARVCVCITCVCTLVCTHVH